jgi:S1-C subfamily serine protease
LLPKAGIKPVWERAARMGVSSMQSPTGVVVAAVEPGSSADQAGLKVGDVLVRVGDIPVEDQNFGARYRLRYANAPEGTPLPIIVMRAGQQVTLSGKVVFANTGLRLEADPAATAKAKGILRGILGR